MSDFDDLRQQREAKKRAEALKRQRELEEYERQREAARHLREIRKANADKLNGMVVDVLEALRDALYQDHKVRRVSNDWNGSEVGGWGIVGVVQNEFGWESYDRPTVVVHVQFDKRGEAKHFVMYKPRSGRSETKYVQSGLSRDDLVRALKKLHAV